MFSKLTASRQNRQCLIQNHFLLPAGYANLLDEYLSHFYENNVLKILSKNFQIMFGFSGGRARSICCCSLFACFRAKVCHLQQLYKCLFRGKSDELSSSRLSKLGPHTHTHTRTGICTYLCLDIDIASISCTCPRATSCLLSGCSVQNFARI